MSKHKVKGTKIDLRTLGDVSAQTALPKGPAERAEDDEGRFRRNHGGKGGDRYGDRDRGYGDRDRSGANDGWRGGGGFGGDRGGGGFGGGDGMTRKPLNLTSSRAPLNNNGPPAGGGLFGRPAQPPSSSGGGAVPPPAPSVDKWSKLENSFGGSSSSNNRFSGLRDSDRSSGGGQFGRDNAPPEVRSNSRFGFVNDEPREGPPRSNNGFERRRDEEGQPMSGGDYRGAALAPGRGPIGGSAAAQVAVNKQQTVIAEKSKAEEKAARAAKKKAEKEEAEAIKLAAKEAKKAAKAAKKEAEKLETESAKSIISTNSKGSKLVELLKTKEGTDIPSSKTFTREILLSLSEKTSLEWISDDEYGLALKYLCNGKGSTQKQAGILYGCQSVYHELKYPKIQINDDKKESLFSKLFYGLYNSELVEEDAFNEWRYADDDDKDAPGKKDGLFQLSDFLKWLDEPPEDDEDEEDDEPVVIERVELRSK